MEWILIIVIGGILGWLASIIMRTDAQQGILLAQIQLPAGDYRVRPARILRIRNLERAVQFVPFGAGANQGHQPVFVSEVDIPIGIGHRSRA